MNESRRNARGKATRRSILDATVTLVSQYGYDSTTISRIQDATGRPASSIYWLFGTKDNLIAEALEASYKGRTGSPPGWSSPDPDTPLIDQLCLELTPELRASETEDPIRLGIMLALEGSAAESKAQMPFRTRRLAAYQRFAEWWDSVVGSDEDVPAARRWQMAEITMALLDGHYTSDVHVEESDISPRANLAAAFLANCCRYLPPARTQHIPALYQSTTLPGHHYDTDLALRVAARKMVAAYGYEGATVARICKESGVRKSSLYWRHTDKNALIRSAVAEDFLELLRPLGDLPRHSSNWIHDLADAVAEVFRRGDSRRDAVKAGLLLKVQKQDSPESAGARISAGASSIAENLASWIDAMRPEYAGVNLPGEHLAWLITRLCDGVMVNMALEQETRIHLPSEHLRKILSETVIASTGQAR